MVIKKSVLTIFLGVCLFSGGCVGPHYTKHPLVIWGKCPPDIAIGGVASISRNVRTNAAPKVTLTDALTGFATTPLKCIGVQGWKDYEMRAEVHGIVVQNRVSTDRFFTVDLKLNSLMVCTDSIPLSDSNFIRLEIFLGNVPVDRKSITNTVALVAKGEFAWDTDGWFEIHPQKTSDLYIESKNEVLKRQHATNLDLRFNN